MKTEKFKINMIGTRDYNSEELFLVVFEHTELQPMGYIGLTMLDQVFRYKSNTDLQVYDWLEGEEAKEDTKHHGMNARPQKYSLETLVKECEEVKQFAIQHFPEYVI